MSAGKQQFIFGNSSEWQKMFRVILKIDKVALRLRQNIQIQLAIKKGSENFMLNPTATLDKCVASFNLQAEFFVRAKEPTFSVYVMLVQGETRKLAGFLSINLGNYEANSNNLVHERLEQSPDAESTIILEFIYLTTGFDQPSRDLVSSSQMETQGRKQVAKEMQQRNAYLASENSRLESELMSLQNDNKNLNTNKSSMNDYYTKNLEHYQYKVELKAEQADRSQKQMDELREQMAQIREMVEEHGSQNLKDKVQEFMKQK